MSMQRRRGVRVSMDFELHRLARRRPETVTRPGRFPRRAHHVRAERQTVRVMMLVRIDRTFGHDFLPFSVALQSCALFRGGRRREVHCVVPLSGAVSGPLCDGISRRSVRRHACPDRAAAPSEAAAPDARPPSSTPASPLRRPAGRASIDDAVRRHLQLAADAPADAAPSGTAAIQQHVPFQVRGGRRERAVLPRRRVEHHQQSLLFRRSSPAPRGAA